jgi:DNA-binding HxlR family transcriptional regulator
MQQQTGKIVPMAENGLDSALERIGDRWSLSIVAALLESNLRFNELQEKVSGIATNTLTQRLKGLEAERVLIAIPYQHKPVRYSYELTAFGRELAPVVTALTHWGAGDDTIDSRHVECGAHLELHRYCPQCDRVVDEHNDDGSTYL